jgi:hypothetical protein
MGFLTPWMLLGAAAAAIPVIIHLFFRSRYRTVPWAAMKFLLTAVEQTSRRLRFQELLLLMLRMLLLIMLAVAFARPISTVVRGSGRGDSVDAVFVFDTSFSMGAVDGEKTRLQRAQDEAIKIIDELPSHSTVQIITCAGNNKSLIGPRTPANLDQARNLIKNLELTSLATDLSVGVADAQDVLAAGQAANKELYVFSDMQQSGFDQSAGELKKTLNDIKEKAVVHFVRCGTQTIKNVAIVGITAQTGVPRPKETFGFAVLVRNTGSEPIDKLKVSLMVDGDEKTLETQAIPKLAGKAEYAATLNAKMGPAGLHVLTARVGHDDLDGDNRYDQVIQVRDQVNILVVDGSPNDQKPELASSFSLMHSLVPVRDSDRATYKYNPRMVPARLASSAELKKYDVCILVNCALQARPGADTLPNEFVESLEPFVRKGRGLIVFSGDNVKPDQYNKVLGKKLGLLPMPLKSIAKVPGKIPDFFSRDSFRSGPPTFWKFKDDDRYAVFDAVPVWQHVELDDSAYKKKKEQKKQDDQAPNKTGAPPEAEEENPVQVIVNLTTGNPLAVSKKVDAGNVIFVGTASQDDGHDPVTNIPNWTIINKTPALVPFLDASVIHLMQGQTQNYNLIAGQTLAWFPTEKTDHAYYLVHPDGKRVDRLGLPEKRDKRFVVKADDMPQAGVYRLAALARGSESSAGLDPVDLARKGTPIAVIPDLNESADLTTLTAAQINERLGFTPIHIIAGEEEGASSGSERLNREWTIWVLLAVMALVLVEVVFAWWCGRGW